MFQNTAINSLRSLLWITSIVKFPLSFRSKSPLRDYSRRQSPAYAPDRIYIII